MRFLSILLIILFSGCGNLKYKGKTSGGDSTDGTNVESVNTIEIELIDDWGIRAGTEIEPLKFQLEIIRYRINWFN